MTPPAGGRNASGEYDPKLHGYEGNVETSLPWDGHNEHDRRTIQNAELQKDEFPLILDINDGKPIGACTYCPSFRPTVELMSNEAWMQSTIGNGTRSSAARAYLGPAVRERPNLTILLNTYITRVLQAQDSKLRNDLRTIELAASVGGARVSLECVASLIEVH